MEQRSTARLLSILSSIIACWLWLPAVPASEAQVGDGSAPVFHGCEELPDFARSAWAATVLVETRHWHPRSGDRDLATGSGVVLAHDRDDGTALIATSAHAVPCDAACLVRVVFSESPSRGRVPAVRARRIWHDPRQDLALLRAPLPPGATVAVARLATGARSPAGEDVLAIGFPDPSLDPENPSRRRVKLFSKGRLVAAHDRFRAGFRGYSSTAVDGHLAPHGALIHTAELLPGSSGGPLIDASGAVVGINTGSLMSATGSGCVQAGTTDGGRCLQLAVALGAAFPRPPTLPR